MLLGSTGCVVDAAFKVADGVPRAVGEAHRKRVVAPWAGRYFFAECRPDAPEMCWTYDVIVDSSGMATVRADGADLAIHVTSKPEVEQGALSLEFDYYIDGNPDRAFFHAPFVKREGFGAGERLATLGIARDGRRCLVFASLRSPLGSRWLCAP
jgi:hypothetical protein